MDEKKPFGLYVRRKRTEQNLTQRELADRLHVSESTVSKWERGLSYPDITLITSICKELGITEHEFFMACDDHQAHLQERAAKTWLRLSRGVQRFLLLGYAAALAACFICNLAVSRTLDWFWIVLTSVALSFCLTSLPRFVPRNKLPICLGAASGCLILLLFSCWLLAGGPWIIAALAIVAACLVLPWGVWALWRFYGKHLQPLSLTLASVWVFGLLAVIHAFTGGGWLLSLAYPIAALGVGFVWLLCAVLWLPVGRWLKLGMVLLLSALANAVTNSFCAWLLPEQEGPALSDYFLWGNIFIRKDMGDFSWVNILIFAILFTVAAAVLAVGIGMEIRRRRSEV